MLWNTEQPTNANPKVDVQIVGKILSSKLLSLHKKKQKMSNSGAGGCLGVFMMIGMIASWLGSGLWAWNLVEPDSFGTAIVFLIAWAILSRVTDFILGLIVMAITDKKE